MKVREVAEMFGVNPKTVTRWANDGLIECMRLPSGHRRFKRSDVEQMVQDGYSR